MSKKARSNGNGHSDVTLKRLTSQEVRKLQTLAEERDAAWDAFQDYAKTLRDRHSLPTRFTVDPETRIVSAVVDG